MYRYRNWGLHITSELPCSGWRTDTSQEQTPSKQIRIIKANVPEKLAQPTLQRALLQMTPTSALITMPSIARIEITNGTTISIQATPPLGSEPDNTAIQLLLENNAVPALLAQRGLLLLRGSAVAIDGRAIAILGPTGAGTSTLAAALALDGAELLADGYCVLDCSTENPLLYPGPAQVNLWGQSIQWLAQPELKSTPWGQGFRVGFSPRTNAEARPLRALWYLEKQHAPETRYSGQNALKIGLKLRQNPLFANGCGQGGAELLAVGRLLNVLSLQPISRPASRMKAAELLKYHP